MPRTAHSSAVEQHRHPPPHHSRASLGISLRGSGLAQVLPRPHPPPPPPPHHQGLNIEARDSPSTQPGHLVNNTQIVLSIGEVVGSWAAKPVRCYDLMKFLFLCVRSDAEAALGCPGHCLATNASTAQHSDRHPRIRTLPSPPLVAELQNALIRPSCRKEESSCWMAFDALSSWAA